MTTSATPPPETSPSPQARDGLLEPAFQRLEALYDPFDLDRPTAPPAELIPFFRWAYRDLGPVLWALVAIACLVGLIEVAIMNGIGALVDRAAASGPDAFLAENGAFLLGLGALILVARPAALIAQSALGSVVVVPGLMAGTVWRFHRHALRQSLRFFEDDFAGRLAQKEIQAAAATDTITIDVIQSFGLIISFIIGMTLALGAADWRLGVATVIWASAYVAMLRLTLPRIRAAARMRAERRAAVTGQLVDTMANIKTVKLFGPPGGEEGAAQASLARYRAAATEFGRATTRLRLWLNVMNAVALAGMMGLSLWLWGVGAVSLGAASAAAILTLRLTAMSGWIAFTALGVFREVGTLEDALQVFSRAPELTDPPAPAAPKGAEIRFEDVRFRYARADAPSDGATAETALPRAPTMAALDGVSLTVQPGEKVGLVGPSGAGKTTLMSLMLRLYDVTDGRISVGGVDVRGMTQADLRAQVGVVTQEAALFNRSALDNIRYGKPEATEADVFEAARRARAHAFIGDLRDIHGRAGYAAHLGERGVKLSGGQRQRIALARAFLKDAPILALDEATSALDSDVEAEILEAIDDLMVGRTVIAIAHRLSTIARMDRIVVLDAGQIVEEGPHQALLDQAGLYARLWSRQSGGLLGAAADAA